ncbi:MAG: LysR family transcriptional regulator [Acetobacteraceae bacterium]|nr:LysR family transcriptional regulator [Acetobacteraceae bacterium]
MDRLDELAVLLAILDGGSLAAASRRLRRSPPTVTRILSQLEHRVGARLVDRTTRALSPTEAGRRLAEQGRAVLGAYAEAAREAGEAPLRGLLRLTAPVVFGRRHVLPVVGAFLDAHPDVQVDLVLADRNLDLVEEGLDVAVRIGRLADSALVVRRVGEVRRVLVASPGYLRARGTPEQPGDLLHGHEAIFSSGRPVPIEWRFFGSGRVRVVRLRPRLLVNEVEAALSAARQGRGLALALSYQVADDLAAGTLVRVLPAFEPPPAPVQLVVPGGRHQAPRVRAFLDHAAQQLSAVQVVRPAPDG